MLTEAQNVTLFRKERLSAEVQILAADIQSGRPKVHRFRKRLRGIEY